MSKIIKDMDLVNIVNNNRYKVVYNYTSVPTIRQFALSDARVRCLTGPFASGKSSGCVTEIIRRSVIQKPCLDGIRKSRWLVVGSNFQQLKDSIIPTFRDWIPPMFFGEWEASANNYHITRVPGVDIEILFRSFDIQAMIYPLTGIPTFELTGVWINNVDNIRGDMIGDMIEYFDSRIGRYPAIKDGGCTWYGVIMDANFLVDDSSYLYKKFNKVKADGWELFKQPSGLSDYAENIKNLMPDYYQNLAIGKDKMYIERYITG